MKGTAMRTPFAPLFTPTLALVVIAALAACAPIDPPAAPPALSSPSPAATGEEEPAGPTPATVVLSTSLILVNDAEGTAIDHFDYFDDPTAAIAAFTEYFGGDPVVTPFPGNNHEWPGNFYHWDDFGIIDYVGGPGGSGEDFGVRATATTVRGLDIETVGGIAVGDTAATAAAAGAIAVSQEIEGNTYAWLELDRISVDNSRPDELIYVYLTLSAPAGTITQLTAPVANFGL